MIKILYPIDLGCDLDDRASTKKFDIPQVSGVYTDLKVYKFGVCVLEVGIDTSTMPDDIERVKLSKRITLGTYAKNVEKYILEASKPYRIEEFPQRYDGKFFYPIHITKEKLSIGQDSASASEETVDILKLVIAQYWNLLSYDIFLNKELDFASKLTKSISPTFNFVKIIKDYIQLFKEGKEFYYDKLNIVNSLYSLMKENPYNSSPELIDIYKQCRQVLGLDMLEKSVNIKIEQVSSTYSFLSESISNLFFLFFELSFFIFLLWGVVDTLLLYKIGMK